MTAGQEVIPKFIMLLNRGLKLPLNGTEEHTRRYVYVTDVVSALNTILHRGRNGKVYNVCSEEEIRNEDLCAHIVRHVRPAGNNVETEVTAWIEPARKRSRCDRGAMMDCSELRSLGWKPLVDAQEGLRCTIDWYTKHGEDWWGNVDHVILPSS